MRKIRPVKLRKESHIKEIWQNFYQKFAAPFKMKKQEFRPGEVSERSKERRALLFGYLSIAGSYFSFYLLLKLKAKFKFNPRL
jgi:hypothetical protein